MKLRNLSAAAAVFVLVGFALHQARSADPAQQDTELKQAANDFAQRYAKAQLRLAELRLAKAEEMNRRVARTLAKGVVEQFADDVAFAKAQAVNATFPNAKRRRTTKNTAASISGCAAPNSNYPIARSNCASPPAPTSACRAPTSRSIWIACGRRSSWPAYASSEPSNWRTPRKTRNWSGNWRSWPRSSIESMRW